MDIILQVMSTGAASLFGWFVGRRQKNAETDNQVIRNLELSINVYRQIIDDLRGELTQLNSKVDLLQKKVDDLLSENHTLKQMMEQHNRETKPKRSARPTTKA